MRKLVHTIHVSLDGRIEGPSGEFDWLTVGPELSGYAMEISERADTFLYGRVVFEMLAAYWPTVSAETHTSDDAVYADVWRSTRKVVVSSTLTSSPWADQIIASGVPEAVEALKQLPGGDILLSGGAGLAGSLAACGLIDEIHVAVHSVVLGDGKPMLWPAPKRIELEPVESWLLDGHTVVTKYHPG